jgi:tripartite-type tricarboxylate transporter receptor subunit TctC
MKSAVSAPQPAIPSDMQNQTAHARWPTKEITLIVPYPPGGMNDQIARIIQPDLERVLKVTVTVQNLPGAANAVAINHVLSRPNDNHTFIVSMDDFVTGPLYQNNRSYTAFKSINVIGTVPYLILGGRTASVSEFKNQIDNRHTVNIGSNGINSGSELWLKNLQSSLKFNTIPYKGGSQLLADVMAGHSEYGVISITAAYPMILNGDLIPLVQSGMNRSAVLPLVPTQAELGLSGLPAIAWFSIFTRNDTMDSASKKFSDEVRMIVAENSKIQRFKSTGMDITNLNYTQSALFFQQQIEHFEHHKK